MQFCNCINQIWNLNLYVFVYTEPFYLAIRRPKQSSSVGPNNILGWLLILAVSERTLIWLI